MTNYEYLKKNGIMKVMKNHIYLTTLPFGDFNELQKEAEALTWLLTERGDTCVQLPKNNECDLRGSDLPFHESGSDEG